MNRKEILDRVNQRLDGRLYRWMDIKYDFDDAILEINEHLQANFPLFTEVMVNENSVYEYYTLTRIEDGKIITFITKELWEEEKLQPHYVKGSAATKPVFPEKYLRTVLIPIVVVKLLQREDEFGNLQGTIAQEYQRGLNTMYNEYYDKIPEYFIVDSGVLEYSSNHNHEIPFSFIINQNGEGPLDQWV